MREERERERERERSAVVVVVVGGERKGKWKVTGKGAL